MSQSNQVSATDVPFVATALEIVALAVSLATDPIPKSTGWGTGITSMSSNSNNSCVAMDLASGSSEFFNIWFLANIEFIPYTTISMLPYFPTETGQIPGNSISLVNDWSERRTILGNHAPSSLTANAGPKNGPCSASEIIPRGLVERNVVEICC